MILSLTLQPRDIVFIWSLVTPTLLPAACTLISVAITDNPISTTSAPAVLNSFFQNAPNSVWLLLIINKNLLVNRSRARIVPCRKLLKYGSFVNKMSHFLDVNGRIFSKSKHEGPYW